MNKCRELLSKLEPSFSAPMKVIMEKFGQQLSGIIKDSLECGICKELIIEVLFKFRQVQKKSFGINQMSNIIYSCVSIGCFPEMPSDILLPLPHQLVKRIGELSHLQRRLLCGREKPNDWRGYPSPGESFSHGWREKKADQRQNIVQQRSTSSPSVDGETLFVPDPNKGILETFSTADLVFTGRFMCIKKACHLTLEITRSNEFQKPNERC